jgi:hypothetical protein
LGLLDIWVDMTLDILQQVQRYLNMGRLLLDIRLDYLNLDILPNIMKEVDGYKGIHMLRNSEITKGLKISCHILNDNNADI